METNYINGNNCSVNAAGLAIKTGSSADALTANLVSYFIGQTKYTLAAQATVDTSAATGGGGLTLADDSGCAIIVRVNAAGTVSLQIGAHSGTAVWNDIAIPEIDFSTYAVVGIIYILNETASDFTIGTTALDVAGSTVVYQDTFNAVNY